MDVEEQRRQLHEMALSRKQLQESVADLQDQLNSESQARNEEASEYPITFRQIQGDKWGHQVTSGKCNFVYKSSRSPQELPPRCKAVCDIVT